MSLALYTHPDMLGHNPGGHPEREEHPERPERLAAVLAALEDEPLDRREATLASRDDLSLVHPDAYLDAVFAAGQSGRRVQLDPDTFMAPGSLPAALRAAGAVTEAVRAVARGEIDRAFCAVRPPGHHAEPNQAMGFCLLSSVAVAARVALASGFERVAIVDFDVHHGNGTQAAFETEPRVLFASMHQWPLYPGTGAESETGVGNILNVTVAPDSPAEVWRRAYAERVLPAVDAFAPDLILLSAGFDAHVRDPLAGQNLENHDFAWMTRALLEVARARCGGKLVSSLEGGYDLQALAGSARAHVQALREG
jgi:acetoin utilization deacetylase AcuC-like enzyme